MILAASVAVIGVQVAAVLAAWALGARESFLRRYLSLFVSVAVGVCWRPGFSGGGISTQSICRSL